MTTHSRAESGQDGANIELFDLDDFEPDAPRSDEAAVPDGQAEVIVHSDAYNAVVDFIELNIKHSENFRYLSVKIGDHWESLGNFLSSELYKGGLTKVERDEILAHYLGVIDEREQRRVGATAVHSAEPEKPWDTDDWGKRAAHDY